MAITDTNTSGVNTGDGVQRANGVINRVRESATAQLSNQKDRATDGLGSVAQAVRQSTQQLRDQQHETIAGYVESAADQIDRLSQRLRSKEVGELLEDVQRLARRQPAVVIGSAFVLGLLGVRFLKSSARQERGYGSRPDEWSSSYGGGSQGRGGRDRQSGTQGGFGGGTVGQTGYAGATSGYAAGATGTAQVSTTGAGSGRTEDRARDAENAGERTTGKSGRTSRGSGKTERS